MMRLPPHRLSAALVALFLLNVFPQNASALFSAMSVRSSVVKIHVTFQGDDYSLPWQSGQPVSGTGSGFIIEKRRILTNAHVVSNAKFLQVQKDGDPRRYAAKVDLIGHDCDLAVLTVEDPSFFKGTSPVTFAKDLPNLDDEVTVLGYPMGGDRLSLTHGVVSRIDYSVFTHSGVDQHLVLQVDAAINPGNSGGPIVFRGKVVGLAFQGLMWAQNIGYGIPIPVISHFLDDIRDGVYDGYPELGAYTMDTRNPALRKDLGLPDDRTGIVVSYIDPFGSAKGYIESGDVLLSIDGYAIENDGNIDLGGNTVVFAELLERKQCGESVAFQVWRQKKEMSITVPLRKQDDPFVYRSAYDKHPDYYIVGGLVFSPLTREYLQTLERRLPTMNTQQLFYYSEYAKMDDLYKDRDEFVVLIRRLPHEVNTYVDAFINGVVAEVNGVKITSLADVKSAIKHPVRGFHVINFAGMDESLVLDAKAVKQADLTILRDYGIPSPEYFEKEEKP
jgi:S1-C subfamily serine protease